MESYLIEFFKIGSQGKIVYHPLLMVRKDFTNLDECIEEGERIKIKYGFDSYKITE